VSRKGREVKEVLGRIGGFMETGGAEKLTKFLDDVEDVSPKAEGKGSAK